MDDTGALDSLMREERVFRPLPDLVLQANMSFQELEAARTLGREDLRAYWEEAAEDLDWFKKWDRVLDDSEAPFYKWFPGARCNLVYNALDRHIETANKNRLALIWEGEPGDSRKFTYYELYREVNRFAGALKRLGVGKRDRVVLYMPSLPETVIAMLAAVKIGAVHTNVYAGFSAKALAERVRAAQAVCVVTVDGFYRNGKVVRLKDNVDKALAMDGCERVSSCVVVHRASVEMSMHAGRDHWYEDLVRAERPECPTEVMNSEDMLFLLYTSGTTGRPKGIVHSHGGYMVGVHRTLTQVFDIKDTDIFWCTADLGWVTGHSAAVYGPLMAGTTTLIYEGHPNYPQADRVWNIIAKYGVTVFYTVPTLIRMLMRFGPGFLKGHDLSTLRLLGTVGEPISPEAWVWFHKNVGRSACPVLDTWWQTETGMFMISPLPVCLLKPGSVARPLPGVSMDVVDERGRAVPPGQGGYLVATAPWPAMMTGVFRDEERYREFFEQIPGCYVAGDVARKDENGFFWIQGRADDVLNIAGHRVGTAELEGAFAAHPAVAEAAVIGVPDEIRGEAAKGYVVLRHGHAPGEALRDELVAHIRDELGPVAVIADVEFREGLPRTRSGKILRRVLKAETLGQDPGDLSVLEDGDPKADPAVDPMGESPAG